MLKKFSLLCLALAGLQGCSGGTGGNDGGQPGTVSVSGTISGLSGSVTIAINGQQEVLTTNGDFTSSIRVNENEDYQVSIVSIQDDINCTVQNGEGQATGNITGVTIECDATSFTAFSLSPLAFNEKSPSILTVAFHLIDRQSSEAVDTLTTDNITDYIEVLEDGMPIDKIEAFLEVENLSQLNAEYHTVFAIDNSSSMRDTLDSVITSIRNTIADPNTLESKLQPNQFISILTFDENVNTVVTQERDISEIFNKLDEIKVGLPSTNLYGAIKAGAEVWENEISLDAISYGSLIVLTDGDDTSSKVTKNEALASIENKDIFFIAASEAVNTQVLGEFTAPSNIFTLNDSANLGTALTSAIDKVKTFEQGLYVLSYATPRRAGNHTLTLNAIDDYDCMTTISDDEAWQMSNSGELTSCLDSKSFSFNADGYTSVTPELEINGSAVTFTKQLEWNAKLRWSHANPDLVWSVITCEGSFDIQQAEDKRSISFERTSQSRAIASVNVYDKTTDTTDKQFLLMATKSSDITTGISLNNICNF